MKTCPYCGKAYPNGALVCATDQTPLSPAESGKDDVATLPSEISRKRTITRWILFVAGVAVLVYLIFPFTCGFLNQSQGWLMLLAPIVFVGWPMAGIFVAVRARNFPVLARIALGVVTWLILTVSIALFPPMAITWSNGFTANFHLTKHPAKIQQWATQVLDRYENGKLATTTNVEYWAAGKDKLEATEIPSNIRNLWWYKPSIGIATMTDSGWVVQSTQTNATYYENMYGGAPPNVKLSYCVAFSWYDDGILVGRPDFKSPWNPGHIYQLSPGTYFFIGEK